MKGIIGAGLIFCSFIAAAVQVERANGESFLVRFEYKVINNQQSPQDITLFLSLPQSNERQEINHLYYLKPDQLINDSYGNKILVFRFRDVPQNGICRAGWFADCDVYAAGYTGSGNTVTLSEKERITYLKDSSNYLITSPLIRETVKEVVNKGSTTVLKAFQIFDFLIRNITYYRDDKWDTAVDVLEKKQGSCSEYNYAFIALLRAAGIPARYTGATVLHADYQSRYDSNIYEDAVFHRWTEFFDKTGGWLPADASRGSTALKKFDNVRNLWNRLPAGLLQTYRGDGGEDNPLGWDYTAFNRISSQDESSRRDVPVAFWIRKSAGTDLEKLIREFLAQQGAMPPESLRYWTSDHVRREILLFFADSLDASLFPHLIRELLNSGHPQAIYFALLSRSRGITLPGDLGFEMFCAGELINSLKKALGKDYPWNWSYFEYWWRKARALITFDKEKREFRLTTTAIDIY